ncbi:putative carboxylic ester hydrolase [Saccharomycopsis crataegensis]|uniref:Carboxylic ester hydrolase n=1 Tax=Saccharomycopsis crataegensis TaxID=43959 RepID=A0AAV5QIP3_9ASCO|nr:putative carboxylic ester hydrolase [Saccharomycopsis crataegensis]
MLGIFDIFTKVEHTAPDQPVEFVPSSIDSDTAPGTEKPGITLKHVIDKFCPTFHDSHLVKLHPLLLNGHFQTAYSQLVDNDSIPIYYKRYLIDYPDGGQGAVDYVDIEATKKALATEEVNQKFDITDEKFSGKLEKNENGELLQLPLPSKTHFFGDAKTEFVDAVIKNSAKPLIVLLHGLSGGSQEAYIKLMVKNLINHNDSKFDIVVLNARGCSNTIIKTPTLYNGIWTDDIRYLINEEILKQNSQKEIYMAGFSLGGVILTNFLAQESRLNSSILNKNIKLAVVVSTPWDMFGSSEFLKSSFIGREIYSPAMASSLKRLLNRNYEQLKHNKAIDADLLADIYHVDNDNANKKRSRASDKEVKYLAQFDYNFTSRMFGFNNHEEYYKFASPINRISNIRLPMVFINAIDDPIVGPKVPTIQVHQNPYLHMLTTKYGGHVCWFQKGGDQWYNKPVAQLFRGFHESVVEEGLVVKVDKKALPTATLIDVDRIVMPKSYSDVLRKKRKLEKKARKT